MSWASEGVRLDDSVRGFIARALAAQGAVIEETPDGLDALLPPGAAAELGVPEEVAIRLSAGESAGSGIIDGRVGSGFLERLVASRLERAPIAAAALAPERPPRSLPPDLPALLNAVRAGTAQRHRVVARYLVAQMEVTLHGDEHRSALDSVSVRLSDGGRTEAFHGGEARVVPGPPLSDEERRNVEAALRSWLRHQGPAVHTGSLETLKRRARRDLEHMAEYYASLEAEMAKAVQRARSEEERRRRHAKWAGLPGDLALQREQLRTRIQPRLGARLVAATVIETVVDQCDIPVRRRSREGSVSVIYRLADGEFEGPACAWCGVATLRVYLCDDRLHVLCNTCGQPGRLDATRCRACRGLPPEPLTVAIEDPTARRQGSPRSSGGWLASPPCGAPPSGPIRPLRAVPEAPRGNRRRSRPASRPPGWTGW